jgi:tryptophanyl-tRNA synthetase (EC 6.1.1.2)
MQQTLQSTLRINHKGVFGVNDSDNIGKLFFPSMQITPAFLLSALKGKKMRCLIPYAIDQDPYFRVARDVLPNWVL